MIKLSLLVLMLSIVGCSSSDRRKGLIPEDKMVDILAEVHLFEARYERNAMSPDSLAVIVKANYQYILQKHGATEEDFYKTFKYYEQNPDKFDELYLHVVDKLSELQAKVQGEQPDATSENPQ